MFLVEILFINTTFMLKTNIEKNKSDQLKFRIRTQKV
jgi:hypothetical protein